MAVLLGGATAVICGDQIWMASALCFFIAGGFFERARGGRWF
jgi:hypothetical protein